MERVAMFSEMIQGLRKTFATGKTMDITWRKEQLKRLFKLVEDEKEEIGRALKRDLGKPYMETMVMEVDTVRGEIVTALDNLDEWAGPQKASKNLLTALDSAHVQSRPLGVALIISAWNYPFQVAIGPLVGALAAGCCIVLKPSEMSPNTASLLEKLLTKYLDNDCIKVVNGGVSETTELLKERFDTIFFTGSTVVGKIIYEAAAKNLTPVTLELGGKSPTIVDETSDLRIAARRILWGKMSNCGQTCISPDYVICTHGIQSQLIEEFKKACSEFYGEDLRNSDNIAHIVNKHHFNRLKNLISGTEGKIAFGGSYDEEALFIHPTFITDVKATDKIMQEEIFGPIMPFISVKDIDEAIEFVNDRPKPLVIYLFTKDSKVIKKVTEMTHSGGIVTNDVFVQMSLTSLPFGGVGMSGMGSSHGKYSFDAFSYKKSCLVRAQNMEFLNDLRYPPYSDKKLGTISTLLNRTPKEMRSFFFRLLPLALFGILLGTIVHLLGGFRA